LFAWGFITSLLISIIGVMMIFVSIGAGSENCYMNTEPSVGESIADAKTPLVSAPRVLFLS
jgi:hypothetical protein